MLLLCLTLTLSSCVGVGMLFHLSKLPFSHLENGNNGSTLKGDRGAGDSDQMRNASKAGRN